MLAALYGWVVRLELVACTDVLHRALPVLVHEGLERDQQLGGGHYFTSRYRKAFGTVTPAPVRP
jgi:hypothetical protein